MSGGELGRFLLRQVATVAIVVGTFQALERQMAGVIAGGLFLALTATFAWRHLVVGNATRRLSFWAVLVTLAGGVLPLLGLRLTSWGTKWESLQLLSVPAPTLHHEAEGLFTLLMVATLIDLIRTAPPGREVPPHRRSS